VQKAICVMRNELGERRLACALLQRFPCCGKGCGMHGITADSSRGRRELPCSGLPIDFDNFGEVH
jgi:hypothetical protein